ncbi:MAG: acyl-CoA dehydrogenase family protein, partial [Acidimicrobiia bacterium]
ESRFGYPVARVRPLGGGSVVGTAADLRRAWQVAIAAEIAATTLSAVQIAAAHVTDRHQFGKPIGSFQAVQHRLSLSFAQANAATWLARRAAWFSHDEALTAAAAAYACGVAELAYVNTHQVCGAIGITAEFGLTARTMRLIALQHDLGGRTAHCRHLVAARRTRTSDPALAPARG